MNSILKIEFTNQIASFNPVKKERVSARDTSPATLLLRLLSSPLTFFFGLLQPIRDPSSLLLFQTMMLLFGPTRIVRPRFRFAPTTRHLAVLDASSSQYDNDDPQHQRLLQLAPTQAWFDTVVLGQKLCPFAAPLVAGRNKKKQNPTNNDDEEEATPSLLRMVASTARHADEAVLDVRSEVVRLMEADTSTPPQQHETTLVVFDDTPSFCRNFRDFVRFSWRLQEEAVGDEYVHRLQLVLFHPRAVHQTYAAVDDEDDERAAADYTIRSPFPTVHLLREQDVMRAVQSYPNLESLPARNQERMLAQGLNACRSRLEACYNHNNNNKKTPTPSS